MEQKKRDQIVLKYIIWIVIGILFVTNFQTVLSVVAKLWSVSASLILGMIMAYILNIVMKAVEKHWFPESENRYVQKSRRVCSMLVSILLIVAVIVLLMYMVVPELLKALKMIARELPGYFALFQQWVAEHEGQIPFITDYISEMELNTTNLMQSVVTFITSGLGDVVNVTISTVSFLTGALVRFVIGFIFSIYILANKETLSGQIKRVLKVFGKEAWNQKLFYGLSVANQCFSKFIIGQCTEAVILGALCMAGMFIIRLPYAMMVGALIGATALIPVMGAYIGAVVGAFMIFTVSPGKALIFIIFLVILQQIEGNVIYPKVVGTSIGLPGLWVLAAVTIGGGLGGVPGMLVGVPATATVYKLVQNKVRNRFNQENAKIEKSDSV